MIINNINQEKRMHIAVVSHIFYPDKGDPFGGFEMTRRLAERGHKVSVITWNKNNRNSCEELASNLTIYRLKGYDLSSLVRSSEYPLLNSLDKIIEKLKPDIVHAQSHLFLTTLQAIMSCKNRNIPSIVTVHGVLAKRSILLNAAQGLYLATLGRAIFQKADKIICLTYHDADEIQLFGCDSSKISVIPNAIDVAKFYPRDDFDDRCIAWVGRFVPEKGIRDIINAAKEISTVRKDFMIILVGDGPLRERLAKLVRDLHLDEFVIFKGALSKIEVEEILARAFIFVLPSRKEGLPLALLEAMSCGKAVVAYDIPGLSEVVQHGYNGILVPPFKKDKFADAIVDLLNDRKKSLLLGEHARATINEKYSWKRILPQIENIYRSCIDKETKC